MERGQWGPELCEKQEGNRREADAVRSRASVVTPSCLLWPVGNGKCGGACPASPARATSRERAQGLSRAGGDVDWSPRVGWTRVSSHRGGRGESECACAARAGGGAGVERRERACARLGSLGGGCCL